MADVDRDDKNVIDVNNDGSVLKVILNDGDLDSPHMPNIGSRVKVHYRGRIENKYPVEYFDNSFERKQPLAFTLGREPVIQGWVDVLKTMKVGEMAEVVISSEKAYGKTGNGETIPPNSTLVFEIELLSCESPTSVSTSTTDSSASSVKSAKTRKVDEVGKNDRIDSSISDKRSGTYQSIKSGIVKEKTFKESLKDCSGGDELVFKLPQKRLLSNQKSSSTSNPEDLSDIAVEVLIYVRKGKNRENGDISSINSPKNNDSTDKAMKTNKMKVIGYRAVLAFNVDNGDGHWEALDWCAKALTQDEQGDFLIHPSLLYPKSSMVDINQDGGTLNSNTTVVDESFIENLLTEKFPKSFGSFEKIKFKKITEPLVEEQVGEVAGGDKNVEEENENVSNKFELQGLRYAHKYLVEEGFEDHIFTRVTLVHMEKKSTLSELGSDDKLSRAGQLRNDGNDWFKKGDFSRASRRYSAALNLISFDQGYSIAERRAVRAEGLLCFLNRSQCSLKRKKFKMAKRDAEQALAIDKESMKAKFRRGMARAGLEEWLEAKQDLEECLQHDKKMQDDGTTTAVNHVAIRELKKVRMMCKQLDNTQKQIFKGAFTEQIIKEKASSNTTATASAVIKKKSLLLYDDKPTVSMKETFQSSTVNTAVNKEEVIAREKKEDYSDTIPKDIVIPDGLKSGDEFSYPLDDGYEAKIRVPQNAKAGDTVTIMVPNDLEKEVNQNEELLNGSEAEMPESGPIAGGLVRPSKYTWPYITLSGLCLLLTSLVLRNTSNNKETPNPFTSGMNHDIEDEQQQTNQIYSSSSIENGGDDGGSFASKSDGDNSGELIMLNYIGFCLLVVGCAGIFDKLKAKSEMASMWLRVSFAISAPTALISMVRIVIYVITINNGNHSSPSLKEDLILMLSGNHGTLSSPILVLSLVTIPLVCYLVRFLGGWQQFLGLIAVDFKKSAKQSTDFWWATIFGSRAENSEEKENGATEQKDEATTKKNN